MPGRVRAGPGPGEVSGEGVARGLVEAGTAVVVTAGGARVGVSEAVLNVP